LPNVLRAREGALGTDAGTFQRLGHVRAKGRKCDELAVYPGDQNTDALYINSRQRVAHDLVCRAKSLPAHCAAPDRGRAFQIG
jgi:hypothetical protein